MMGHEVEQLVPVPGVIVQELQQWISLQVQNVLLIVIIEQILLTDSYRRVKDGAVVLNTKVKEFTV